MKLYWFRNLVQYFPSWDTLFMKYDATHILTSLKNDNVQIVRPRLGDNGPPANVNGRPEILYVIQLSDRVYNVTFPALFVIKLLSYCSVEWYPNLTMNKYISSCLHQFHKDYQFLKRKLSSLYHSGFKIKKYL
jgi:hypothetical protein